MSGKKLVFKMVPGEELSKGFGSSVYWPDFFRFQSVKKVKLVQLEKEDEAIELPIRLCGNNIARDGYSAPICLDHFFQSNPIFKMNILINT
ncbi:MAG: hypothetical protein MUP48_00240, partial [Wolbachia endosymbiont of Homalodisca vitripennis]|nr:hypothetical protein [Wolbachia endosymbiont of Homalodisca vitripennis]MCJ7476134.1 hypothetical protein [Wolbachia endosymbiont of Homalodisca vitripennis]